MKKVFAATTALAASTAFANTSTVTVDQIGSGGYQASYYLNQAVTTPEIHVLGIYEHGPQIGNTHALGDVTVNVLGTAGAPVDLVLSSYEPTHWVLQGSGAQYIHSILVNGYYASDVSGIDSSLVLNKSGAPNWLGSYAYAWPSTTGGSDTQALVSAVENIYGAQIASFSGAYSATQFTVNLSAVPEPGTFALAALGLGALGMAKRRKLQAAQDQN